MKRFLYLLSLAVTFLVGTSAHAQWKSETYTLKGGWNSIYLPGDAKQDTLDNIFPASVLEVWRWNPNPDQVQFTSSPLLPTSGTAEWSVWKRGLPAQSNLSQLIGRTAYLVKCSGTTANTYSVQIRQSHVMPANSWVRNGANFLGFPSFKNGSSYPTFNNYFATFPGAVAANTKVFKYVGGDLGPANPIAIFSTLAEPLDRTQAYWFSAELVGNFVSPYEITLTTSNGLAFGRTGSVITARIRNRTAAGVTLTLAPVVSEPAPASQTAITGPVPLTKRVFNTTTLVWDETPITVSYTELVAPGATVELNFGINRVAMTGAANAFYASFLRITDSANFVDIHLPATAQKASLAGLWVGDISLKNVSSQVSNIAKATASFRKNDGAVTALSVTGTGGFGYTTAPTVTISAPISGTTATATAIVANGSVTGFTLDNGGSGYEKAPTVTIAPPPPLTGTTTANTLPLRSLLHVADDGTARLLSQVFVGQLAVSPFSVGICASEASLKQDAKAGAQRLVATHLPMDQVISSGTGTVALPGILVRTIDLSFTDATNPFVHQYHPDHDNKDARGNALGNKVESYTITRVCTFTFTATPPSGSSVVSGWGSSVIGGTYTEVIKGLSRLDIETSGTFELRRASEIGTFTP